MTVFPLDRGFLMLLMGCAGILALMPICVLLGNALGLIDHPRSDGRRVHQRAIPRVGGLALALVFPPLAALSGLPLARSPWFIGGFALLVVAGTVDDRSGMRAWGKLACHIVAIAFPVIGCGLIAHPIPLLIGDLQIHSVAACTVLTIFVGVGLVNALNLIDGLDGLAAGIAAVTSGALAVLAAGMGNVPLCIAAMSLLGCLIGILAVNTHPARIFLGDTGSMLLGYVLACFSLALIGSPAPGEGHYSVFLPLLLLVVPWSDAIWVMAGRLLRNRDPFDGDRTHVHHQVLGLGIRHRYAVMILVGISALVACIAILVRHLPDGIVVLTTLLLVVGIIGGVRFLTRDLPTRMLYRQPARWTRWHERRVDPTPPPRPRHVDKTLQFTRRSLDIAFGVLLAVYAISGQRPSGLLGAGALLLLSLILFALVVTRSTRDHFVQFLVFCACVYLALASALWLPWQHGPTGYYLSRAVLIFAFAMSLIDLWVERRVVRLLQTPLELLGLLVALAVAFTLSPHYPFNVVWVSCSAMCLHIILKAMALPNHSTGFATGVVMAALATFAIFEFAAGALFSFL
jgi:UDP-GlcNAc:undecaprenyl-phosphate GlcNAc-1-phosphate transferase